MLEIIKGKVSNLQTDLQTESNKLSRIRNSDKYIATFNVDNRAVYFTFGDKDCDFKNGDEVLLVVWNRNKIYEIKAFNNKTTNIVKFAPFYKIVFISLFLVFIGCIFLSVKIPNGNEDFEIILRCAGILLVFLAGLFSYGALELKKCNHTLKQILKNNRV